MKYTAKLENGVVEVIEANDMREVEVQMYDKYGVEAIGLSISGDANNFSFTVCKDSWERVLKEYFPNFSIEDVLNHLKVQSYAWLNFDKVEDYDYYEDCKTISLCEEGLDYIRNNDALAVEMDRINFYW